MWPTDLIPEEWRAPAARLAESLRGLDRVIVAGHVNPDGDALGSVAAVGWMLRALGREFVIYSRSGVPAYLDFLPLPGIMHDSLQRLPFRPGAAVLLDCGEPHRLGDELEKALPGLASLNMDHHLGSAGMGSVDNWIEPEAAATAQLAAYVAICLDLELSGPLGEALALGLVTDTGGFAHGNTSAAVLHLAAHLVDKGCDISLLRQRRELQELYMARLQTSPTKEPVPEVPDSPRLEPYDAQFMKQVTDCVEQNMTNPDFEIEQLAEHLNVCRTVFYRKLKSITGLTPVAFVGELRLKRAIRLMEQADLSISQVAYMTGFKSPKYFSTVFKKATGCTPSEYRERKVADAKGGK